MMMYDYETLKYDVPFCDGEMIDSCIKLSHACSGCANVIQSENRR